MLPVEEGAGRGGRGALWCGGPSETGSGAPAWEDTKSHISERSSGLSTSWPGIPRPQVLSHAHKLRPQGCQGGKAIHYDNRIQILTLTPAGYLTSGTSYSSEPVSSPLH